MTIAVNVGEESPKSNTSGGEKRRVEHLTLAIADQQ